MTKTLAGLFLCAKQKEHPFYRVYSKYLQ